MFFPPTRAILGYHPARPSWLSPLSLKLRALKLPWHPIYSNCESCCRVHKINIWWKQFRGAPKKWMCFFGKVFLNVGGWGGWFPNGQTRSRPPQITPKIAFFNPNFTFSQTSQKPWGGRVVIQIWEKFPKKTVLFFGGSPYPYWWQGTMLTINHMPYQLIDVNEVIRFCNVKIKWKKEEKMAKVVSIARY